MCEFPRSSDGQDMRWIGSGNMDRCVISCQAVLRVCGKSGMNRESSASTWVGKLSSDTASENVPKSRVRMSSLGTG